MPAQREIEIVDFEPALAAHFKTLNEEWLNKYFCVEPIDHEILGHPEEQVMSGGGAILFAKDTDVVVGTAALKHHGDGVYELTKMAVTPRCQGKGIGPNVGRGLHRPVPRVGGEPAIP